MTGTGAELYEVALPYIAAGFGSAFVVAAIALTVGWAIQRRKRNNLRGGRGIAQ